jgi:hypothetical protein
VGTEQATTDGALDAERWFRAKPRTLFLGKQPHDRGQVLSACGYDLCRLFRESKSFSYNKKIFETNLSLWSLAVSSILRGREISFDEAMRAPREREDAWLSSAVVNICKTAGGPTTSTRTLIEAAERNRKQLAVQLSMLKPDVVICCGTFDVVRRIFRRVEEGYKLNERFVNTNKTVWIDTWHPSHRMSDREKYEYLAVALRCAFTHGL